MFHTLATANRLGLCNSLAGLYVGYAARHVFCTHVFPSSQEGLLGRQGPGWQIRGLFIVGITNTLVFFVYPFYMTGLCTVQYVPWNMLSVCILLCCAGVKLWLIYPYPSGLLHWQWDNLGAIIRLPQYDCSSASWNPRKLHLWKNMHM